jgi:hypothetical protein
MKVIMRNLFYSLFIFMLSVSMARGSSSLAYQKSNLTDTVYLNAERLILTKRSIILITDEERNWGEKVVAEIKADTPSNFDKAARIQKYVSANFKYRISAPRTISGIIDIKGGNCISHTILGLFLLRLSGVPAKVCHELQLNQPLFIHQLRANSRKAGYFGSGYNSHYWVMFFDGKDWQPYDSALDITGFDEFFLKRTATKRWPYLISLNPVRITGPAFIIEEQSEYDPAEILNITDRIWEMSYKWNNKKVTQNEWNEFVGKFKDQGFRDFVDVQDKNTRKVIRKMAGKWF